ncbi:MAG: PAS domain S-box protein, partial [Rhodocyclaceae bacterium]|nr:PAS domain S-box protein [Rhodocyclaceae bacterium]
MAITAAATGCIIDVNGAWCESTGISRSTALGKTFLDLGLWADPAQASDCAATLDRNSSLRAFAAALLFRAQARQCLLSARRVAMPGHSCILWEIHDLARPAPQHPGTSESDRRLAALIEATSDAIFIKDTEGIYRLANQSTARFLGRPLEQVIGADDTQLFAEADARAVMATDRRVMQERRVQSLEEVVMTADGTSRTFHSTKGPMFDDSGKLVGIFGIARDITERRRDEAVLREREAQLRIVSDNLPGGVIYELDTGPDGTQRRFTYLSSGVQSVQGISVAEGLADASRLLDQMLEEDRPAFVAARRTSIDQLTPFDAEFRIRRTDGSLRWVTVRAAPRRNTCGNLVWDGILLDITETKRAQEAFLRAQQNYQMLFREMLNGFALHEIICDASGKPIDYRFIDVNPAFERMTGLNARDCIGRRVLEVLPGTEKYWIDTFGKVALSGEPIMYENYSAEIGKHFE